MINRMALTVLCSIVGLAMVLSFAVGAAGGLLAGYYLFAR